MRRLLLGLLHKILPLSPELYTPPPVPGRILPSPGGIPGFLVDFW